VNLPQRFLTELQPLQVSLVPVDTTQTNASAMQCNAMPGYRTNTHRKSQFFAPNNRTFPTMSHPDKETPRKAIPSQAGIVHFSLFFQIRLPLPHLVVLL
jgi:hypothetical protein